VSSILKMGVLWLALSLFHSSCEEPQSSLPGYAGGFGELLVVVPNSIWKSPLGDSIYNYLGAMQYGLPQDERQFNIIHVTPQKFKSVLQTHRNICIVSIDSNTVRPITLEKSKWSRGQIVITLSAKNSARLLNTVREHAPRAAEIFASAEVNRHYLRNKKFGSKTLNQEIGDQQQLTITTQKDMIIENYKEGVSWLRLERERDKGGFRHQISQGILLFSLPYTDESNFADSNIYHVVDSVLKVNLPGPGENQYMQLNFRYIVPQGTEINFKDQFGKEYRGLWRMENNAMGGPIYLLVFLDEKSDRVVYAYGYVYAPQFNKREYLREVQGVIHSISIPKDA